MKRGTQPRHRDWRTSVRVQLLVLLLAVLPIVVLMLNGACAPQPVPLPEPLWRNDPSIPGLSEPRTGVVGAIDAVWTDDAIHVVWTEGRGDNSPGRYRLYYARALDGGTRWSPPTELASEWSDGPLSRIVKSGGGLHIIFSKRLRHLESIDSGQSWTERQSFLSFDATLVGAADVIASDGTLCVAYLSIVASPPGQRGPKRLTVVRLTPSGSIETSRDFPLSGEIYGSTLQFVVFRQSLFLFGGNAGFAYVASEDAGRSWGDTRQFEFPWRTSPVRMSVLDDRLTAIWSLGRIVFSQSSDGKNWTAPFSLMGGANSIGAIPQVVSSGSDDGGLVVWKQYIYPQTYGPGPDPKVEHVYAGSMRDTIAAQARGETPAWPGFLPASANASCFATVSSGNRRMVLWSDGERSGSTASVGIANRIFFTPFPIAEESELARLRAATVEGRAPSSSLVEPVTGRLRGMTIRLPYGYWSAEAELTCLPGPAPPDVEYLVVFFVPGSSRQRWSTEPRTAPTSLTGPGTNLFSPGHRLPMALAEKIPSNLYATLVVTPASKPVDVNALPESTLARGAVRVAIDRRPSPPSREGPDGPRR